ncbi:MAG TPA: sodium:calcium symporter [Opitutaceae bacterium]|nr:sodium:calcium symporter [Opitutaceae bacterium]
MNPLSDLIENLGISGVWTYLGLFLGASMLMVWRLEALLDHGLEGTALGTLVMPYCSGLGNLIFVAIVARQHGPAQEILTNCLVNNVTNLTLVLAIPALIWGLSLRGEKKSAKGSTQKKGRASAETAHQLTRLSLLLTLVAALFFGGALWVLGRDGRLEFSDGLALVALFLFWQCIQVFDVLKHNVRRQRSFSPLFYLDVLVVLIGAYGLYVSIEWLVTWLSVQKGGFVNATHLGWLSGWLMVLPNALLALYYAARRRPDIVYASQVGDGHVCIPLCIGIAALISPLPVPAFFETGLAVLLAAVAVHFGCVAFAGGLPRWMGWPLLAAYAGFVGIGLLT